MTVILKWNKRIQQDPVCMILFVKSPPDLENEQVKRKKLLTSLRKKQTEKHCLQKN